MTQPELTEKTILCPYCGESIDILVDCSIDDQEYIEDCQVCCCPILINATVYENVVSVSVRTENE
jgi:hypothetical protein